MEDTEAIIVPVADRHNNSNVVTSTDQVTRDESSLESLQAKDTKEVSTVRANPSIRSHKDNCSKKRKKKKKKSGKDAKLATNDGDGSCDSSVSSESDASSDDGDEKPPGVSKPSKKMINVMENRSNKKNKSNKSSFKKAISQQTTKRRDKETSTPQDSESDSDFDSSDSLSSGDEKDDRKGDVISSTEKNALKRQLRAMHLETLTLLKELHSSSMQSQYGAYTMPVTATPTVPGLPQSIRSQPSFSLAAKPSRLARGFRGAPPPPPTRAAGIALGLDSDENMLSGNENERSKTKNSKRFDFRRVDWIWDNTMHNYRLQDTIASDSEGRFDDYVFHVRRTFDWEGKYRATLVDIKSKLLRECLQDVIGNVEGVSLVEDVPKLNPNILFLYLKEFYGHWKALKQAKPAGDTKKVRKKNKKRLEEKRKHLKVLIKYIEHDYKSTKESLYPLLNSGLITFDLLWALWKPNTLVYTTTYGTTNQPRIFKAETAHLSASIIKGSYYFIEGKYFEFDGKRFGYGGIAEEIDEFHGARKITSLPCYPLQYHKDEEKVRKALLERGKKFVALGGVRYKAYQGIAFMKRKKNGIVKFNIQPSRIMVDPTIFRRINPNYSVSLVRPKDHDILSDNGESSSEEGCCCDGSGSESSEKIKYVAKVYRKPDGEIGMVRIPEDMIQSQDEEKELDQLPPKKDGEEWNVQPLEFTDEEYLLASPVVLGFAFSEKRWLEFPVAGIADINWNEEAWDSLVLESGTKDLIKALVESRKYHAANTIDDVIQGKGKGLVTVLHGPPGTGKTLTAEGISELLKCPLYMVSAGELGTDSRYLEAELQKILDICHAWGAILLLDEADVFLEKRNMHDIHRNALVSIFLRQLEYFQGILFLTTNRVETFDEAFQSRIHIALRYDNLDTKAKRTIFEMFLERVRTLGKLQVEPLTDDDLTELAKQDLNGREIKNVVGSAQDLAVNKGEALSMRHIKHVLHVHAKFGRDLKGGTGYEDAMRSYF